MIPAYPICDLKQIIWRLPKYAKPAICSVKEDQMVACLTQLFRDELADAQSPDLVALMKNVAAKGRRLVLWKYDMVNSMLMDLCYE